MGHVSCTTLVRLPIVATIAALLLSGCGGDSTKQEWYLRPAADRIKATAPAVWKW